jgi:hypothetical protein
MKILTLLVPFLVLGFAGLTLAQHEDETGGIDKRSYRLGGIGAFAEVVGAGVKKLALSSAMTPQEMDALMDEAKKIAERNSVNLYRETDFLVTDLFPASVTEGKHVLLIYLDPVKEEYMALKTEKEKLIANRKYDGEARLEIARGMGRLLSYTEEKIEALLAAKK